MVPPEGSENFIPLIAMITVFFKSIPEIFQEEHFTT